MRLYPGPSFLGTFALAILSISALFGIDVFLARVERSETRIEAGRLFERGKTLMERGNNEAAIEPIQEAISVERGNQDYTRTLAEAQLAAGRPADAATTLGELLQADPGDGSASLTMGRVLLKQRQFDQAISYYHRAIYGHWQQDPSENRLRARFELIDLLAQHGSKEDLLAELLLVQDQAPGDVGMHIRIGRLFLAAGSPSRAEDVFRTILREDAENADAYAGLGESEFARGDFRAAQRNFQMALRLAPDNQAVKQRLEICADLLMLDPTVRGLGPAERYRRSIKLVELVLDDTSKCVGQNAPPDLSPLVERAGKILKSRVPAARNNDAAESNLDLAEQLWQLRKTTCSPTPTDTPLSLVLARLAQ